MNTDKKELHRGEIYICDFVDVGGSVQNGLRPALIIQNSAGNEHSTTVIVSPITTIIKKEKLPTHVYLGAKYGLPEESMVMLEQIFTVDKNYHIRDYVGLIEDKETLSRINDALRISLALNRIRKNLFRCTEDVLSFSDTGVFYIALCDKCRKKLAQDDRFLMVLIVKKIIINADGSLTIEFVNGKRIKERNIDYEYSSTNSNKD